jgi:hypothetical protein
VGIEAAVERHQHRELAAEARETMTAEIRKNDKSVGDALQDIEQEQQRLKRDLTEVRKVQTNPRDPAAKHLGLDISYGTTGLEQTGWQTAQATGALAYMPYAEAEKYTSIYRGVELFLKSQDQLAEDESRSLGIIEKYRVGSADMTKEAADALAEQFGIWQGHVLMLKIAARVLQEQQRAFLEGREPIHNMSEHISEK